MRVALVYDESISPSQRVVVRAAKLGQLLRGCGDELGVPTRLSLALKLSDDAVLHQLNLRFLGVDAPTDVLAFPGDSTCVGDIAISVERALAQAACDSRAGSEELRLLAVHGLLHCLGYDHVQPADARRMTQQTRRLLPEQEVAELVVH